MRLGRDSERETTFAVKKGPPSNAVIEAVAEAENADATDLSPVYDAIDPDALDALFTGRCPGEVAFDYEGYTVIVREEAEVTVRE